ncbi:MAG: hypothetical protein JXO22_00320, partial [Phycisphaerae bacterium]|nr:hypothetical protein [Phycisphaerae bacterium]
VSPSWMRTPFPEHGLVLLGLKQRIHLNSDRIYATGYSMGGHGSWTMAILVPDQLAGVMPIAGSLNLPQDDLLDNVLPNLANTHVFVAWGRGDNRMANGKVSPTGGIAGTNQRTTKRTDELGLPVVWREDPEAGHSDVVPPQEEVFKLFSYTREHYPRQISKTFRALHESSHYWLEADKWIGVALDGQGDIPVVLQPDENAGNPDDVDAAITRALQRRVARLEGTVDGQTITVQRKKIHSLTIWIGDGMIDWAQPINVKVGGRQVFNDRIEPDLLVCLLQAVRTYDFERLRWAGIRYETRRPGRIVTRRTKFPPMYSD